MWMEHKALHGAGVQARGGTALHTPPRKRARKKADAYLQFLRFALWRSTKFEGPVEKFLKVS
jgi:hypothetical protein